MNLSAAYMPDKLMPEEPENGFSTIWPCTVYTQRPIKVDRNILVVGRAVHASGAPNGLVDICSDGHVLNRLRNPDLVVKKIYRFLRQNVSSKFRNTGKLNSFCFRRGNFTGHYKMRKKPVSRLFRKSNNS